MKELKYLKLLMAIVLSDDIDEVRIKSQEVYSLCISSTMFVVEYLGDISPFSWCFWSWGQGLCFWAWYRGDSGAGFRAHFFLRPSSWGQRFTSDWPPPWNLFMVWLQEAIPFTSETQKLSKTHQSWTLVTAWPYREPAEENIWSHCSNEWMAINLKQSILFLLFNVVNEIVKKKNTTCFRNDHIS